MLNVPQISAFHERSTEAHSPRNLHRCKWQNHRSIAKNFHMSINGHYHLAKFYIRFFPLLMAILSGGTFAQDGFSRIIAVTSDNKTFAFHCDGTTDSSTVHVVLLTLSGEKSVLKQRLDAIDDCSQASWLTEKIDKRGSSMLVLLNPGRSGLDAQYSAFLVSDESVALAGYLPVNADKVSDSKYRSYSSDMGSVWERTDSLLEGVFSITNELQLVIRGSVCTNNSGEILDQATCNAAKVIARPGRPICVGYKFHKAHLLPASSCARLIGKI
ncbi:hypothetical protein [Paraburkholderia sediminicola]|uniref:hypothetical protein n=1 Tax=Paraburkholderia sediminicola TaxID=458836 RepID=UPI0038BA1F25